MGREEEGGWMGVGMGREGEMESGGREREASNELRVCLIEL